MDMLSPLPNMVDYRAEVRHTHARIRTILKGVFGSQKST